MKMMLHLVLVVSLAACVAGWDETVVKLPVVTPGQTAADAPSDAIVLFDGSDLDAWVSAKDGQAPKWTVRDGYMEVVDKAGDIRTKDAFGSCQLHVEWAAPEVGKGANQARGNSGVFLMGQYEIQVLDNYENETYAIGYAGSVYGQKPPLVNACRKPGEWQTYDIVFTAPVFKNDKLDVPARLTMFHNGVLVHHYQEIYGDSPHRDLPKPLSAKNTKGPIVLLAHHSPVRFRNIWIRPIR